MRIDSSDSLAENKYKYHEKLSSLIRQNSNQIFNILFLNKIDCALILDQEIRIVKVIIYSDVHHFIFDLVIGSFFLRYFPFIWNLSRFLRFQFMSDNIFKSLINMLFVLYSMLTEKLIFLYKFRTDNIK